MSMIPDKNIKYLVALSHFSKFGPVRLRRILAFFNQTEDAFHSDLNTLKEASIEESVAQEFIAARPTIDPDQIMDRLDKENISVLTLSNENYPKLLSEIYDPPQLFYYKGEIIREEFTIAIVGTRKLSSYGHQTAEKITRELVQNNITIVSGLALGIDSVAHNTALAASGRTVAVIGSGLDRQSIYPSSNRYLADKIVAEGGAVISEFPLDTAPLKYNFPQRNRIIAGLSLGTVVVEAAAKSGALITAQFALEQNREVFAVPGNIYSPVSAGPNNLIKQGGHLITAASDILDCLNLNQVTSFISAQEIIPETDEEKTILAHISHEPIYINDIVRLTNLDIQAINSTLIIMEMKGIVRNLGNMQYVLGR